MKNTLPVILLAAVVLIDVLLCGFAAGATFIASGVMVFQTLKQETEPPESITQEVGLAPVFIPPPTYTPLPTQTPYPTHTPRLAQSEEPAVQPGSQTQIPTGITPQSTETLTYVVQTGDTLESIASDFNIDPQIILSLNNLDPDRPNLQPGDILSLPIAASETAPLTPNGLVPSSTMPASTPGPRPTLSSYPYPTSPLYP